MTEKLKVFKGRASIALSTGNQTTVATTGLSGALAGASIWLANKFGAGLTAADASYIIPVVTAVLNFVIPAKRR